MQKRMMLPGVTLAGLLMMFGSLFAQPNEVIITIGLEAWQENMLNERVLQGFYDAHPGVKVVPVIFSGDEGYVEFDTSDVAGSLDKAAALFGQADVISVHDYNLYPIYTRAGLVMDLTPLIRADVSGAVEDFQPVALKVFEWDNGIWALPAALRLRFMAYDTAAFDNAGYPHPDSSWTLNDYLDAARALTVRDDSGNVTQPGFFGFEDKPLLRAFLRHGFYDNSNGMDMVALDDPELEALVAALDAYNTEMEGSDPENSPMQSWDWSKFPLQMGGIWMISDDRQGNPLTPVAFPGDAAIVSGEGFAISAGTLNPELAYELITFLTSDVEITASMYGEVPVRYSLEGQSTEEFKPVIIADALAPLLPTMLENAIPSSELRYGEYLALAKAKMEEDENLTLHEALLQAQEQAISDFELAVSRVSTPVVVSTPVPTPVLASGEIALKFSLQSSYYPTPGEDAWDLVTQEFIDADPEVGYIEYVTNYRDPAEQFKDIDCAYTSFNLIPSIELSQVLPLDPLLAADSQFDRSDTPEMIWNSVTREGRTYGLPVTLMPLMMWYRPADFEAAGVELPRIGWTVSEFLMALQQLKDAQPDLKPYRSQNFGNVSYVLLAASLGGVAVDYSTFMPTYHLTDPDVVEALRQTLDMAATGYIDYFELDSDGGGKAVMVARAVQEDDRPTLYDGPGYVQEWAQVGTEKNPFLPVTFPRGADIVPLSFEVGAAYIASGTQYADACYRWISTLAQHPELFNDMPARRSLAASPTLIAAQGQPASDFYVGMYELLDSPQAFFLPAGAGTASAPGAYIADIWFNQALDAYVLESANLESALADAQQLIDEYRTCTAGITPMTYSLADNEAWDAYYKQFTDCAVSVDPSLAERFEGPRGG